MLVILSSHHFDSAIAQLFVWLSMYFFSVVFLTQLIFQWQDLCKHLAYSTSQTCGENLALFTTLVLGVQSSSVYSADPSFTKRGVSTARLGKPILI
jgi:hypothetical protein